MQLLRVERSIDTLNEIIEMPGNDVNEFRDAIEEARDTTSLLYSLWRETDLVLEQTRNRKRPTERAILKIVDNTDELS